MNIDTRQQIKTALPALSRRQVQTLFAALKMQNKVWIVGKTSAAKWYPHGRAKGQNNDYYPI